MSVFNKKQAVNAADKYIQQGKVTAAISEYQQIVNADPTDLNAINTLGDLYARDGQNRLAIAEYLRVAEYYTSHNERVKAVAMYKKIQKLDTSNYDICLKLAELHKQEDHFTDAKQQYNIALEGYTSEGKTPEALKVLKDLTEMLPDQTDLRLELGRRYLTIGLKEEALQEFANLGNYLLQEGKPAESILAFQEALAIDANYRNAFKGLVEAYAREDKIEQALRLINDILTKDPQDEEILALLGNIYIHTKMYEQAESTFSYLFELAPSCYNKLVEVAQELVKANEVSRAMRLLDRCLETLIEHKVEQQATAVLTEMLKLDSMDLNALRRLGYIYLSTQQNRNLIATLKLFIQAALTRGTKTEAKMALQQLLLLEPTEEAQEQLVQVKQEEKKTRNNDGVTIDPLLQTFYALTDTPVAAPVEPLPPPTQRQAQKTAMILNKMFSQNPELMDAQIKLLEEMVADYPDYLEGRIKLKDSYLAKGMKEHAAMQFFTLENLYETKGDKELAKEMHNEGYKLSLLLGQSPEQIKAQFTSNPVTDGQDIFSLLQQDRILKKEWGRAARYSRTLSLVIAHIDHFSIYIARHGQETAYKGFEDVAKALNKALNRPGDELICYPGLGFVVVLPETPTEGAVLVAERLRIATEKITVPHFGNQKVTLSLGVASSLPVYNSTPDGLIEAAHIAQQQASKAGGNRIVSL